MIVLIGAVQQSIQGHGCFPFALAFVLARQWVENGPPADGLDRRVGTEHEAVPAKGSNGLVKANLDEGLLTGQQLFPVEEHRRRKMLCRSGVEADFRPVFEGTRGAGKQLQLDIDQVRGHQSARHGYHIAALDEGPLHGLKVDGRALAGMNFRHFFIVNLQASDLGLVLHRVDHHLVADAQLSGHTRSGYNGAETAHAENAIHRQAKRAVRAAWFNLDDEFGQGLPEFLKAFSGSGGNPDDRAPLRETCPSEIGHIVLNHLEPIRIIHQVDLGEDHQSLFYAKQFADFHVLPRLGHDSFIGGNHQGNEIDAGGPGHHVLHKSLMPRNIDDSQDGLRPAGPCRQNPARW